MAVTVGHKKNDILVINKIHGTTLLSYYSKWGGSGRGCERSDADEGRQGGMVQGLAQLAVWGGGGQGMVAGQGTVVVLEWG